MAIDIMSYAVTMLMWGMFSFIVGVILLGIGVGVMLLIRHLKYKVKLDIYEKVGGAYMGFGRDAREVINKPDVKGKRHTFLLLRTPFKGYKKIPLPDSASYVPFASKLVGNRKKLNLLFKDTLFAPLPITENSDPAFNFDTKDLLYILNSWDQDYAENLETHKWGEPTFMDKYGMYVLPFSMILIMFVLFFILIQQIGGGVQVTAVIETSQLIKAAA